MQRAGASFHRCRATIRQPHSDQRGRLASLLSGTPRGRRATGPLSRLSADDRCDVGDVLARRGEGVLENTLVLFMTDHGISHARGKQFLYDEGLHVPLVILLAPVSIPGQCGMMWSTC